MKYGAIKYRTACILVVAALLSACAGIPRQERDHEQLERYVKYAGPPVDHFTYLGRYDGWQSLGRYQLVLWTTINDAYLITVLPPCEDLQFTQRIGLTSTAHTVSARFDNVLVRHWRCQISEIRPVDYLRMKQDLRAEHAAQKARKDGSGDNK
ncbi:MAG: DUF6491 family protein [Steroidobacteraceae bacterium]